MIVKFFAAVRNLELLKNASDQVDYYVLSRHSNYFQDFA